MNEVAIGYMKKKIVLNPPQDAEVAYEPGDRIILISEDDREYIEGNQTD